MPGVLSSLKSLYRDQMERQQNRPFLEAVMSASALVSSAGGPVSLSERMRLDQIINALEELKVFDPHEAVNLFNEYAQAIRETPETGREQAYARIAPLAQDPETAALILRICLGILQVEGENNMTEQIEIVSLCSRFGIDPSDCGLYIDMPADEFLRQARPQPNGQ